MKFSDIPQMTSIGSYQIDLSWSYLEGWIERQKEKGLDLNPDFQREHVWTEEQQTRYVEFGLRGGYTNNVLYFNCVGWMKDFKGPFVIVDGKQRLTTVLKFLKNELKAFDHFHSDFEDNLHYMRPKFQMNINNLKTRREVLQWYLEMNEGATPHTEKELLKVKKLLVKES